MLFAEGSETELKPGPTAEVSLELRDEGYGKLEVGFTRGCISSQAYAKRFENADIEPSPATAVFDTEPSRSSTAGSALTPASSSSN
jgi:hypothetical protein